MIKVNIINVLLIAVIGVLILTNIQSCQRVGQVTDIYGAAQDSIKSYVDKDGKQITIIAAMLGQRKKDLLAMKSSDSTIIDLQKQVKDYKGKLDIAINLKNKTGSKGSLVTIIDTVHSNDSIYLVYTAQWKNKWEQGLIVASRDSIFRDIVFFNEFEINIGKTSNGWFKKPVTEAMVKNLNPNTLTTDFRSFKVDNVQKRLAIALSAGYGMTEAGLSPYVGIGLGYNILYIK